MVCSNSPALHGKRKVCAVSETRSNEAGTDSRRPKRGGKIQSAGGGGRPGRPGYERRSLLITANQLFGEWGKVFPGQAMTLAAIDRLVHHSTIIEMNVESYRRRTALERKRGPGRPPSHATPKTVAD